MRQDLSVLLSHESTEWYTPPEIIETARTVLGTIDLDPASHEIPQRWIRAKKYYTVEDDGLSKSWYGKIWLNPPYSKIKGKSSQKIWLDKLYSEYNKDNIEEAIILVKASLGYRWFDDYFKIRPWCLKYGLISFISPEGKRGKAKLGSAFFYFGDNFDYFCEVFSEIGKVGF
jgi:phage N-6-adenine-methyltransferase